MLKAVFLIVAFSFAFTKATLDEQELWPPLENPSDLSSSADVGEMLNDQAIKGSDQNLFLDGSTSIGEYAKLEPQPNTAELDYNDGLLAGLGSPSEPFDPLDPFGFGNKAGPLDKPDCGSKYLLCCSGKPFGAGLYSKCSWCMLFSPIKYYVQQ